MTQVDIAHTLEQLEPDLPVSAASAEHVDLPAGRRSRSWRVPSAGRIVRNPGQLLSVGWVALVLVAAFAPDVITWHRPLETETQAKLQPPSWNHLFGTDQLGRDLFSRTVHGSALTLRTALLAVAVGLVVGGLIGLVAGFFRGRLDDVLMRCVDVILSIPSLLLALALITVLGFGAFNVGLAVGLANVAACARIMRSEVLRVRQSVFVEAAQTGGASWIRVLGRHVLPNSVGPLLVLATLEFGVAILTVAALSFLGYGTQPPTPEWGSLVASGRDFMASAWWLTTLPGVTVAVTVLAANRIAHALDRRYAP